MLPPEGPYRLRSYRCAEALTLAWNEHGLEAVNQWMAVKLLDGSCDHNIYGSKAQAVRFQVREKECAYLCIQPGGMLPAEAEAFLNFTEEVYDKGYDLTAPDVDVLRRDPNPLFRGAVIL